MSSKYKVGEDTIAHFVTFAVVGWVDVFSRECYKEIFMNSLKYCQEHKGLKLHASAAAGIQFIRKPTAALIYAPVCPDSYRIGVKLKAS